MTKTKCLDPIIHENRTENKRKIEILIENFFKKDGNDEIKHSNSSLLAVSVLSFILSPSFPYIWFKP
jgi:hypothetical protein